jgi:hypothetical protein
VASFFDLGTFSVNQPDPVGTTYFNATPFEISYSINKVDGETPSPNTTPVLVRGEISGSVIGIESNLRATFHVVALGILDGDVFRPYYADPFSAGPLAGGLTLSVASMDLILGPNSTGGTGTVVRGAVFAQAVPEPNAVWAFALAVVALIMSRVRLIPST